MNLLLLLQAGRLQLNMLVYFTLAVNVRLLLACVVGWLQWLVGWLQWLVGCLLVFVTFIRENVLRS